MPVKDGGAYDGLHQVVGESHTAHSSKGPGKNRQPFDLADQHNTPDVGEAEKNTSPTVEMESLSHEIFIIPVMQGICYPSQAHQWEPCGQAND
jgi:hypothetical protein